jgi:hypothetical protein
MSSHPSVLSDAEILKRFREFHEQQAANRHEAFVPLQNHPNHRGVLDQNYVRPAPAEYPKMVYHIESGEPKIVHSKEEQAKLKNYSEIPKQSFAPPAEEEAPPAVEAAPVKSPKPAKKPKAKK